MKKLFANVFMLLLSITALQAQHCETYFPMTVGAEYELTQYDANDKVTGRTVYKVKTVNTNASGTDAVFYAENYDKKGEKSSEGEYKVICRDNTTRIDMKAFMLNNPALKGYENMDISMTGDFMEFPNVLTEGMSLPDATMMMIMTDKESKAEVGRVTMKFTNRKVVGKVSVTTPAGTYDAWKITQEINGVMLMMSMNINMPVMYSTEYVASGKGLVKSETFDKDKKLKAYSLKTK